MPLYRNRIFPTDTDQSISSGSEYRTRYMSPRQEDYIPHVALPKMGVSRLPSRSRSFVSFDVDPNYMPKTSEYGLGFINHRPKRPYVFHAQPTNLFDPLPTPNSSRLKSSSSSSRTKFSEYQERFAHHRSDPLQRSSQSSIPPPGTSKKDRMTRSQYFHDLIADSDKSNGGQRYIGNSEQRIAFQWPSRAEEEASHLSQPSFRQFVHASH